MYRFIVELLQPHLILFLWACWALFRLWRHRGDPRRRWWPLVVPLFCLAVLSTQVLSSVALRSLESYSPPLERLPSGTKAIVVFSAGVHPPEGPRTQAEMDEDTFQRCLTAARLWRQDPSCLMVVSGGKVEQDTPGPPYAAVMAEFLKELQVNEKKIISEEDSRTTHENAVKTAQLLKDRQIQTVVLVVSAMDMPRASRCLRKEGIEVIPAPCHFRATRFPISVFNWLPSAGGARGVEKTWHEWLGMAWYWGRGWI